MQASEVVDATGLQARYVEEWLKGMTASGYLEYNDGADTYLLPEEHAFLLASEGTDHFMGGLFYFGGCPAWRRSEGRRLLPHRWRGALRRVRTRMRRRPRYDQ